MSKAKLDGAKAAVDGYMGFNPYPSDSLDSKAWAEGYLEMDAIIRNSLKVINEAVANHGKIIRDKLKAMEDLFRDCGVKDNR